MAGMKQMLTMIFNQKAFNKLTAYSLLILVLYVFRDFLGTFLLTFLFWYLFFSIAKYVKSKFLYLWKKINFFSSLAKIPLWVIVLLEYLLFIWIIIYGSSSTIPTIKSEINSIVNEFSLIKDYEKDSNWLTFIEGKWTISEKSGSVQIIEALNDFKNSVLEKLILIDPENNLDIIETIENFWTNVDFKSFQEKIFRLLGVIGSSLLNVISALILSFIFILDRKKVWSYLMKIKKSNFWFFYTEYEILFDKIVKSFWLILKAQSLIAFVNAFLTIIWLVIIGFVFSTDLVPTFPYILTLWLIVFIFGFIPVLGVVISSIPIMIIWYITYGDIMIIPTIIILISIIHVIEAYYLNPKIVSSFLKLPMSLTFVILLVSWKILWVAWLLVWISLFYFSIWLLKDFDSMIWRNRKRIEIEKEK